MVCRVREFLSSLTFITFIMGNSPSRIEGVNRWNWNFQDISFWQEELESCQNIFCPSRTQPNYDPSISNVSSSRLIEDPPKSVVSKTDCRHLSLPVQSSFTDSLS